ncbi:WG repeat-containing protein [Psychroserpens algicola]|uniref:WG repeat-containing protein n=1 Tax=Psychroserpens algicola TaxID=1719034 RepID=A0ABT0HBI5_9FLAO|nr:WG repeat-containing protein [Psychroserpens algicola]MCK8481723.1 WG repeat-containing protein [Psychroserpens algicola]
MKIILTTLFTSFVFFSFSQEFNQAEIFPFRSRDNGKIGYVNNEGEIIIEPKYSSGTYFDNEEYATVSIKNDSIKKFAVIDKNGNYLISFNEGYELISLNNNYEDWILVIKKDKWGYINYEKETIIPLEYEHLGDFYGDLAFAKKDGKYGFINSKNEIIIDFEFDWAFKFGAIQPNGLRYAKVEKNEKLGFINNKGILEVKLLYDFVYQFYKGIAIVKKENKYGCINTNGDIVVPFKYEFIDDNDGEIIKARKKFMSNKEYHYNRQGDFIGTAIKNKR